MLEKLNNYKPKIAVFNGKAIYQVYSGQKNFLFGRQPEPLFDGSTWVWVMPSSSARCAQLPRAIDKVPFYDALRKFRDFLSGKIDQIDECEITFANVVLTNWPRTKNSIEKEELKSESCEEIKPDLQTATDDKPANVSDNITQVIEDVIMRQNV